MSTTTSDALRDKMVTVVAALTPTIQPHGKFRYPTDDDGDIRNWAENNPTAAFRSFAVYERGVLRAPTVSNTDVAWTDEDFECIVCYARNDRSRFGSKAFRSLMDVIKSDQTQIEDAIGTHGFQTIETVAAPAVVTSGDWSLERGIACLYSVLPLRVQYYRAF